MTIVSAYIAENTNYLDEGSRSILESLNDEQFAVLVAASDAQSDGCQEPGIDNGLVRTHETLEDFDKSRAAHWSQRGRREKCDINAPAIRFEDVQMFKGQPRHTFVVVDLGEFRVVVK